jgi:hypothetical protein
MGMRIFFAIGCLVHLSSGQEPEFTPRCGDCWCIPEGGTVDGTCPEYPVGIWQGFPDEWSQQLSTFALTSDPLILQTASGETDCYPFSDAVGGQSYPGSTSPQCQRPLLSSSDSDSTVVCAFKYAEEQACRGREYDMQTYASAEVAVAAGAYVTHSGACGVCSNAQDLGVRMDQFGKLRSASIFCATGFAINRQFPKLIQCYENIGFTDNCSLLWAHFAATNAELCAASCVPDPVTFTIKLTEEAPTCALGSCLNCSASQFEEEFNLLAGRWRSVQNSGFSDEIPYSCDTFYLIEDHDPCVDSAPAALVTPTMSPTMSAAARDWDRSFRSIMMMVSPILLLFVAVF